MVVVDDDGVGYFFGYCGVVGVVYSGIVDEVYGFGVGVVFELVGYVFDGFVGYVMCLVEVDGLVGCVGGEGL